MELSTVRDVLYWSYANLAMAHAAVSDGAKKYDRRHFIIRTRLYHGLRKGIMNVGALAEDEKLKLIIPQACCYCGSIDNLAVDHLLPRGRGGPHQGENMVWACRPCNSSKGVKDVLEWYQQRDEFPPLLLLRRYLKLAIEYSGERGLLDEPRTAKFDGPFALSAVPLKFPPPPDLTMWRTQLRRST